MLPVNLKQLTKEFASRKKMSEFKRMFGILPDPDKILAENNYDYSIYRDLLTDPHLAAAVQQRKYQIMQMEIKLFGTAEQKKRGVKVLNRISTYKLINECLDALLFGFSPLEISYDYDEANNELLISDISEKPQEWFIYDEKGELRLRNKERGFYTFEPGARLPDFKFIIVRNMPSSENPYGQKLLSNVYWSVAFKRAAVEYWQDRVERYGLPFLEGEYPASATEAEIKEFEERVEEMLETNLLIKKEGYSLHFREPAKYDLGKIFEYIIDYHNSEISKAILSETLTVEIGKSGSYKVADIHREMLEVLGIADKRLVEITINRLLQYDQYINFGKIEAAKAELSDVKGLKTKGRIVL